MEGWLSMHGHHTWLPKPMVVLSALLGGIAHIVPAYADWLVFIFLLPLFTTAYTVSVSAYDGLWWGIIFFSMLLSGVVWLVMEYAAAWQGIILSSLLIVYCALYSATWFWIATVVSTRLLSPMQWWRIVCWIGATIAYFCALDLILLKIIGLPRGYVFASPLVPLAHHSAWLVCLSWLSSYGALALLVTNSALFSAWLVYARSGYFFVACCCMVPFLYGWISPPRNHIPNFNQMIVCAIPPDEQCLQHPLDAAQEIQRCITQACVSQPMAMCVCFPESTYPFPLSEYPHVLKVWQENAPHDCTVLMCCHDVVDNNLTNKLILMREGRIIQSYDKKIYFPFVEYIPYPWQSISWVKRLFLENKRTFRQTELCRPLMQLTPTLTVAPYICADLFFGYPDCDEGACPILWLVNDSWFSCRYLRHTLFLFAKLQACMHKRPIIYVGHDFGAWIDVTGGYTLLPRA